MKKLLAIFCYAVLSITVLYLAGCRKLLDYIRQHPQGTAIVPCAINDFDYAGPFQPDVDIVTFSYDGLGNPVSAVRQHVAVGSPNVLFRYDHLNRLNNLICHYGSDISGGVEGWIKYFYGVGERVLWDSVYSFPVIVNGHPTLGESTAAWVDTYEYDAVGRIIKTRKIAPGHAPADTSYVYDSRGNLVTGYTYDDSVNFHRTNKIWQFLDRDYSLNNPITGAIQYSSIGLPQAMDLSIPSMRFMQVVLSAYVFSGNNIHYICH